MKRSDFLRLMVAASFAWCVPALASDGDNSGSGGGGGDSSGDGGGGNSGSGGSGNSGSGGGDDGGDSDNSGHGGGDDDDSDDDDSGGHDKARQDAERGRAAKLKSILKSVRRRYPGEVVSVKYQGGKRTYRIKVLKDTGALLTISVDAASARVLKVTGE